jgi:hypothetical protein
VALAVFLGTVGCVVWLLLRRPVPVPPEETTTFRPLRRLDADSAWPRQADVQRILSAIAEKRRCLPVIVGASGAGKTILLDILVPASLSERPYRSPIYLVISSYHGERQAVDRAITDARDAKRPLVLVLDQFEQWLAGLRSLDESDRVLRQAWLKGLVEAAADDNDYTVLLSVRAEWYYELRFLGALLPSLSDGVIVEGASMDVGDDLRDSILASFQHVVANESIAQGLLERLGATGRLSPLEAQLVGATVERERAHPSRGTPFSLARFDDAGGVSAAVEGFFDTVLGGAPDPRICLKVLCAFSIETSFRQQLDRSDLGRILFDDPTDIQDAADYLVTQGLLLEPSAGRLDLAHDYVAAVFRQKSSEELHPTERDNVVVHVQALRSGSLAWREIQHGRPRLGRLVLGCLSVLMTLRLLNFGFDWTLVGKAFTTTVFGPIVDASYIPVVVGVAGWLVYGSIMYDGVFRRLDESSRARALSVFTIANLCFAGVVGVFWPSAWLLTITWGGIPIGFKLATLARRNDLSATARHHLWVWAWGNLFLSMYVGFLGAAQLYLSVHAVHTSVEETRWLAVNSAAATLVVASSWALAPVQASRSAVSQLKGVMARPKGAKVGASEGQL